MDYSIKSPETLIKNEFDKIVIATYTGFNEVSEQLKQLSIPAEKIDAMPERRNWARKEFLRGFADIAQDKNLAGNVAELGVYRGDFARHINAFFPQKTLYLLDTFEGFTKQDIMQDNTTISQELDSGHFSNTSVKLVLSKMPHPHMCVIKKGWFPDSATGLENEQFCFVSLDTDLYAPILAGLEFFYPKLVVGGVILIDDYFSTLYEGTKKAVNTFCATHGVSFAPIGDSSSVIILKENL